MATIKVTTPDGFTFELTSLDDAVALKRKLDSPAHSRQPNPLRLKPEMRTVADSALSHNTRILLDLLWKATAGLNTEEIAKAINISAKGIPPLIRNLHGWAEGRALKLDDLMDRQSVYVNRKPLTRYHLTESGRKAFSEVVVQHNVDGAKPKEEQKTTA